MTENNSQETTNSTESLPAKRKTVAVGTPMYGGMCTYAYVESLLALEKTLDANGYNMGHIFLVNESLIQRARNEIAAVFLKSDADYLLFIDADHRFNPADIMRMIDSGVDVIAAVCPKKVINWDMIKIAALLDVEPAQLPLYGGAFVINTKEAEAGTSVKVDEPLAVLDAGTGIMLISRKALEELSNVVPKYKYNGASPHIKLGELVPEFFYARVGDGGYLLSEDYAFCRQWQALGHDVYVAPWMMATHVGTYEFTGSIIHNALLQLELSKRSAEAQTEEEKVETKTEAEEASE